MLNIEREEYECSNSLIEISKGENFFLRRTTKNQHTNPNVYSKLMHILMHISLKAWILCIRKRQLYSLRKKTKPLYFCWYLWRKRRRWKAFSFKRNWTETINWTFISIPILRWTITVWNKVSQGEFMHNKSFSKGKWNLSF